MSVVCAACKTENRDNAMFCRGCAAKLPGFAATGPSALETMKTLRPAKEPAPSSAPAPDMLPIETRGFWIRLALLSLAILAGFVGWYAYVTRRVPAPATTPIAARTPAPEAPRPAPAPPPIELAPASPVAPVPTVEAKPEPAPKQAEPSSPNAHRPDVLVERWDPPRKAPARNEPADPRPACAHLNFVAAAQCEAALCNKAGYRRHPHCGAVREQRRRDEARRNPTLGY
jgi:hypothetical protein